MIEEIRREMRSMASPKRAEASKWFFKTGPGEYGHGDVFVGLKVPDVRRLSRKYRNLSLPAVRKLLRSPVHEERQLALFILVLQYETADPKGKAKIFQIYMKNLRYVNNWDLVDASAPHIIGDYLQDKERRILIDLARSRILWERRIAILATLRFIKEERFQDTFRIARMLLNDGEDLIHKAVGWMLREVGNRDLAAEEVFLKKHYRKMPRTMLRYAIEKFPEPKRRKYLEGRI